MRNRDRWLMGHLIDLSPDLDIDGLRLVDDEFMRCNSKPYLTGFLNCKEALSFMSEMKYGKYKPTAWHTG